MKNYISRSVCVCVFVIVFAVNGLTAQQFPCKEIQQAPDPFLSLLDTGKYEESWALTAQHFKANVGKEQWVKTMQDVRQPLGKLNAREIDSVRYTKSLPNAPKGEYLLFQYNTSFEAKAQAVETVVLSLEKDNKWRVSGFYIK